MKQRVGIIIPCYNVEQFLEACLQSVINQSYKNLCIVIVNDGSTDSSFTIAWKYFLQDERIILVDKPNGGISSARNVGLDFLNAELPFYNMQKEDLYYILQSTYEYKGCFQNAQQNHEIVTLSKKQEITLYTHKNISNTSYFPICDYIHFLDSDDLLMQDCIMQCMHAIQIDQNPDIIWHDFYKINEHGKVLSKCEQFCSYQDSTDNTQQIDEKSFLITKKEALQLKLSTSNAFTWHGLIRLQILSEYRLRFMDSINHAEDQLFSFFLFTCAEKIYLLPIPLIAYRVRDGSLMSFNPEKHKYPHFKADIYESFHNKTLAYSYDISLSWLILANAYCDFMQNFDNKDNLQDIACYLVPRSIKALQVVAITNNDPKDSKRLFVDLLPYLPKNHIKLSSKIAYHCPLIYKIFHYLKTQPSKN